jgi:hypothetical protein
MTNKVVKGTIGATGTNRKGFYMNNCAMPWTMPL